MSHISHSLSENMLLLSSLFMLTDVLKQADKFCSGHQECEFHVANPDFEAADGCFVELKMYLEAAYTCVKGKVKSRMGLRFHPFSCSADCTINAQASGLRQIWSYLHTVQAHSE